MPFRPLFKPPKIALSASGMLAGRGCGSAKIVAVMATISVKGRILIFFPLNGKPENTWF